MNECAVCDGAQIELESYQPSAIGYRREWALSIEFQIFASIFLDWSCVLLLIEIYCYRAELWCGFGCSNTTAATIYDWEFLIKNPTHKETSNDIRLRFTAPRRTQKKIRSAYFFIRKYLPSTRQQTKKQQPEDNEWKAHATETLSIHRYTVNFTSSTSHK